MLVASYDGPADYDAGPVRVASASQSNRSLVGMTTNFITNLLSYAETTPEAVDANIATAHAAVTAMALQPSALSEWAESVDVDARAVRMELGVYADPGNVVGPRRTLRSDRRRR